MDRSRPFSLDLLPAACAGALACASGRAAVEVRVDHPPCTLSLPDGFVEYAEGKAKPEIACAYRLDTADDVCVFTVWRLGGVVGREDYDLKRRFREAKESRAAWGEFSLQMFEVPAQIEGQAYVTLCVQVPLKPEAAQLVLLGPRERSDELAAMMRTIVAGLEGETNWLTSDARAESAADAVVGVVVLVALFAFAVYYGRKKPPAPAGGGEGAA